MINCFNKTDKEKYVHLDCFFKEHNLKKIMLVCGKSFEKYKIKEYFLTLKNKSKIEVVFFQDFRPNPEIESVIRGKEIFMKNHCDGIIAVGGGSAIDVAKGIKFYSLSYKAGIPFLAIPTTAGTGSEATHFAVVYEKGEKKSIADNRILPDRVILDENLLVYLPLYHKKSALMDAYCHAIESFLSIYSTEESEKYAECAITLIQENYKEYLKNEKQNDINYKMLIAANYAGKAINISKTTAGHALSYKLTSLYGITHGHAVALCMEQLWFQLCSYITLNKGDSRITKKVEKLCKVMQCTLLQEAAEKFSQMCDYMQFSSILTDNEKDIEILTESVNVERLRNYPIKLSKDEIKNIYEKICL